MNNQSILSLKGIDKSFAGNKVLDSINLDVAKGSVHAVVGENGAGKSTLMKIIGGIYTKDSGEIRINNTLVDYSTPIKAMKEGVSIVHQELSLAENLTVAQNVYSNREPANAFGFIREKELNKQVGEIFRRMGVEINPRETAGNLSVAQQQLVEIAKALSQDAQLIIMDEPTSSLSEKEVDYLYSIVDGLKADGLTLIFISHKLDEVFRVADRISVLRDGLMIGTVESDKSDTSEVIQMMVGRHMADLYPAKNDETTSEVIFEVRDLSRSGVFEDINFSLYKGEILGFSGLVGAGRSEIARAIFGADPLDTGTLLLYGKALKIKNPKDSIRQGVCYLTEDRKLLGLFQNKSVRWNLASASLRSFVDRWGFYKWNDIKSASDDFSEKLDIRPRNDSLNVVSLSGGNQQKVLMGKWLSAKPKVLIVDEPTRGVDVGAKSQIHLLLREMADSGIGVIVISSEQPEVIGLCDRILVFCEGKITKDFGNQVASQEEIMKYASGVISDEVRS